MPYSYLSSVYSAYSFAVKFLNYILLGEYDSYT